MAFFYFSENMWNAIEIIPTIVYNGKHQFRLFWKFVLGDSLMPQTSVTSQSTWRSKIKAMGPGILMASAAVGGSHIVSSTQAGGSYGWALLG